MEIFESKITDSNIIEVRFSIFRASPDSFDPIIELNKAVEEYSDNKNRRQFSDIKLDDPFVPDLVLNISAIPFQKFDSRKHKL